MHLWFESLAACLKDKVTIMTRWVPISLKRRPCCAAAAEGLCVAMPTTVRIAASASQCKPCDNRQHKTHQEVLGSSRQQIAVAPGLMATTGSS